MKTSHSHPVLGGHCSGNGAFTLLELMVVMAIIAILSTLAVPAAGKLLGGSHLSQAAQIVVDQLSLARQSALSLNHLVEVRFYQYGDSEIPGENPSNPGAGRYRALQTFEIADSGTAVALGKMQRLPGSVVIDTGSELSSILGSAKASPSSPTLATGDALNVAIPRVGTKYNAVSFRFLPDGAAKLSPSTDRWYLTLHGAEAGDGLKTPPPNFFTIQINAINGHIQTFRP
jgi:uncharacterized protein (TIGR02596 family)